MVDKCFYSKKIIKWKEIYQRCFSLWPYIIHEKPEWWHKSKIIQRTIQTGRRDMCRTSLLAYESRTHYTVPRNQPHWGTWAEEDGTQFCVRSCSGNQGRKCLRLLIVRNLGHKMINKWFCFENRRSSSDDELSAKLFFFSQEHSQIKLLYWNKKWFLRVWSPWLDNCFT